MCTRKRTSGRMIGFAATAVLALTLPAGAQSSSPSISAPSTTPPAVAPAEKVNLTMEQKHIIKEIILKDLKVQPQSASVPMQIGDKIPSGIPLQPMPVEVSAKVPQLKSHSFVVKDDKVVIVDPKDNKVAALVE